MNIKTMKSIKKTKSKKLNVTNNIKKKNSTTMFASPYDTLRDVPEYCIYAHNN